MKCTEKNCDGRVDILNPIALQRGCSRHQFNDAYPCSKCGALHWWNGSPVVDTKTGKKRIFSSKEGNLFFKNGKGEKKIIKITEA